MRFEIVVIFSGDDWRARELAEKISEEDGVEGVSVCDGGIDE